MTDTTSYEYQLIASGILPLWAGILVGLAVGVLLFVLLRGELRTRKRQGPAIRVLYINRALIGLILGLLLVQPVLYINKITVKPAQLVLAADRSRSMLRVDAIDPTTLLNLAAVLHSDGLESRPTAAGDLARLLDERKADLATMQSKIAAAASDLSQGLPLGTSVAETLEAQATQLESISKEAQGILKSLSKISVPTMTPTTTGPAMKETDAMAAAQSTVSDLSDLTAAATAARGKPLISDTAEQMLKQFDGVIKSATLTSVALEKMQSALDQQFLTSLKPEARKPFDAMAGRTRFEWSRLVADQIAKDPQIAKTHRVILADFDALTAANARSHTDVYSQIDSVLPKDDDAVLSGLVLFSDGQQNLPRRPEVMRRMTGRLIPFIGAGVGSTQSPPYVALVDFQTAGVVQRDKKSPLVVTLKTAVPADTNITITLSGSDDQPLARLSVKPGSKGVTTAAMEYRLTEAGMHLLKLTTSIERATGGPQTDSATIPVYVLDHQARALVISQWPRWDMVYAMQSMSDRPVRVDSVFWGTMSKAPNRGSVAGSIPDSLEVLKRYQVIVLDGAVYPGAKPEDSKMFADFVTQQGGSVVLIKSQEQSYANAWSWLSGAVVASAIPTTQPGGETGHSVATGPSVTIAPTPSAEGFGVTHLAADSGRSLTLWASLAPIQQTFKIVPQSVSMLEPAEAESPNGPLLTLGFKGRGKVYMLGIADLFRAREWAGGASVNRFMAHLFDDALTPLFPTADAKVAVYPPAPIVGAPGLVVSRTPDHLSLKAGDSASDLSFAQSDDKQISPASVFTVPGTAGESFDIMDGASSILNVHAIQPVSMEDVDFQLDPAGFAAIAKQANGKYVALADLPASIRELAPATERSVVVRPIEIWNQTVILIVLAVMMTLDWYLRRKSGLVL